MPIQTNLAIETVFFHEPIPATPTQVRRLNAVWRRQPPRHGCIVAGHTARGLVLTVAEPVVLIAVAEDYWRELGRLMPIADEILSLECRAGSPNPAFCECDSLQPAGFGDPALHPALSLYRIMAKGEMHFFHSDTPEALWPRQYPAMRKRSRSTRAMRERAKKWQFAPDLVGIFEGPRDLSTRKAKPRKQGFRS
jgi:hypothetical protein